ncbi:3-dehydroquinate synthase [Clostridium sp.]|uniref:3-dehydroquinate synthase n=1 Tax=Clostridium sp. TaxID=1506 RepID=UPI003463F42D
MKKLRVNLKENSYDILIDKGILSTIGTEVRKVFSGNKIAIITDENLESYYKKVIEKSLLEEGFNVKTIVLKPGEKTKDFSTLPYIYEEILDFNLTRSDLIIAFGGGVIGDIAGFVSATYLRGISFIQVPTSLLAQVDSSVGGKVAVDLHRGKNLVGAFYQPKLVIIDVNVLNTLEDRFFNDGMAEVIKYGCIKDKKLFSMLCNLNGREEVMEYIEDIVYKCCDIKREVVERDERDTGERMILNFGHTLGHAIEKYYNYETFTHGEAVAVGMHLITTLSEEKQLTKKGVSSLLKQILIKYNLHYNIDIKDKNSLMENIKLDKKNLNNSLNLICIKDIGECCILKEDMSFFETLTL